MLSKARSFRLATQRPKPKAPTIRRPGLPAPSTALPGVSATDKKKGAGNSALREKGPRHERKASVVLEDSLTGRPSRKSTRRSANHQKPDSNLQRRQTRKTTSPKNRAQRGK